VACLGMAEHLQRGGFRTELVASRWLVMHTRASPALGRLGMMRRRARAGPRRAGGSKGNLRVGRGIEGQLVRGPGDRRAACAWAAESKKQTCARAGDRRATCAWAAASKARTGSAGLERAARVVSCSSTTCVGFERLVEFYMLARYRAGPLVGMGASVVAHAMFCSPASVVAWCEAALAGLLSVRIASLSMCIASLSMRTASLSRPLASKLGARASQNPRNPQWPPTLAGSRSTSGSIVASVRIHERIDPVLKGFLRFAMGSHSCRSCGEACGVLEVLRLRFIVAVGCTA
jgi:hypothetical protein